MSDEIVIKVNRRQPGGWSCPHCGGPGHMSDGSVSFTPNEVRIRPPTPCHVCKGKGWVLVLSLPDAPEDRT